MMSLPSLLRLLKERVNKNIGWIFLVLSFIGFLDALYLTITHYSGATPSCSFLKGCDLVVTSQYSTILGVPVALLGAAYYFSLFVLSAIFIDGKRVRILVVAAYLTAVGFLASLWFLFLQIFIIQAICIYCLISAATSTLLFVTGMSALFLKRRGVHTNDHHAITAGD